MKERVKHKRNVPFIISRPLFYEMEAGEHIARDAFK